MKRSSFSEDPHSGDASPVPSKQARPDAQRASLRGLPSSIIASIAQSVTYPIVSKCIQTINLAIYDGSIAPKNKSNGSSWSDRWSDDDADLHPECYFSPAIGRYVSSFVGKVCRITDGATTLSQPKPADEKMTLRRRRGQRLIVAELYARRGAAGREHHAAFRLFNYAVDLFDPLLALRSYSYYGKLLP